MTNFNPRWHLTRTHLRATGKAASPFPMMFDLYAALPQVTAARAPCRNYRGAAVTPASVRCDRLHDAALPLDSLDDRPLQLFCNGDEPASTPKRVGSLVLEGAEDDRGFGYLYLQPRFAPGDKIRVLDGAFSAPASGYSRVWRIANV